MLHQDEADMHEQCTTMQVPVCVCLAVILLVMPAPTAPACTKTIA